MDNAAKTRAIISHLTIIGWAVAWLLNRENKKSFTDFYLRQTLGIYLLAVIGWFIPVIYPFISFVVFITWLLSIYGALTDREIETPLIGHYFQDWFKLL